ncbi:MAG: GDP-mannose 4,6-dehydratase [Anaerolineales bacterium]|nr:GDP-mannose 4,6-dehydratase [Anaerolineales bacterium]MBX3036832.1 GDP-mannose 4,6-dehydratase [Anaerolineales bacterium]
MTRALITGSSGFVGSHLTRNLLAQNWQVAGFDILSDNTLEHFYQGHLTDKDSIAHALNEFKPDVIFHLAGLIKSNEPQELYASNVQATVTLLETVVESNLKPEIILASSSAVYGLTSGTKKINEKSPIHPVTHYAVSKVAQELVALRYFDAGLLPVKIIRMFNLLGPGQSPALACSAFAKQIALAEKNNTDEIVTGNLDALRDFVDVRDAVRAFEMIVEHGEAGEIYNVCSAKAVSLKQCLGEMMSQSQKQLSARIDAEKIQTNDIPIQVGSYQKIKKACGWSPQISLKKSLTDLLNDWRERVKSNVE